MALKTLKTQTITVDDAEIKIIAKKPTAKDYAAADVYSSQIFAKMVKERDEDGNPVHMLRAQLNEFLKSINLYTEDDINRLAEIGERIEQLEKYILQGGEKEGERASKEQGRSWAVELRQLRSELLVLMAEKVKYDNHTVESYCENARINFLLVRCLLYEDETQVFNSVEDYQDDETIVPLIDDLVYEISAVVSSFDPDFDRNLPENKFFVKYGYCDEDLKLIDPVTGKRVNDNGDFINEKGEIVDEEGELVKTEEDGELVGDFGEDEVEETESVSEETEEVAETVEQSVKEEVPADEVTF